METYMLCTFNTTFKWHKASKEKNKILLCLCENVNKRYQVITKFIIKGKFPESNYTQLSTF